ncbi:hypothetical protein ACFQT0_30195 [Hymenobacter humi]|uniref:Uncharacterized protein n=1 Tax=Hymenobacter humi TaxID=1411620 RepID=A0ABW2UCH5_9BACT
MTGKGRQYVFDDLRCMANFLREHPEVAGPGPRLLVADFNEPATWLPVQDAHLVRSPAFHTPMNGQAGRLCHSSRRAGGPTAAQPAPSIDFLA